MGSFAASYARVSLQSLIPGGPFRFVKIEIRKVELVNRHMFMVTSSRFKHAREQRKLTLITIVIKFQWVAAG